MMKLRYVPLTVFLSAGLLTGQEPAPPAKRDSISRHRIVPEKELLITDPAVTGSPAAQYPGPLSFGYLMERMAGREHAGAFTRAWLELWLRDQEVNADIAPARQKMEELVLISWRQRDDSFRTGLDSPALWVPDLANAPFKLIAIVNRMDLMAPGVVEQMRDSTEKALRQLAAAQGFVAQVASPVNRDFTESGELFRRGSLEVFQSPPPMSGGFCPSPVLPPPSPIPPPASNAVDSEFITLGPRESAPQVGISGSGGYGFGAAPEFLVSGEGRLVYALTDGAGKPLPGNFNVIFEYHLSGRREGDKVVNGSTFEWAARWHSLGRHASFDEPYLADLVAVTKGFTDGEVNPDTGAVVRSFLAQIRTNDGVLGEGREFREFRFVPGTTGGERPARLRQVPVSLTPADRYRENGPDKILAMVLKSRTEPFRKHVPLSLPVSVRLAGSREPVGLLGARALLTGYPARFRWNAAGIRDEAQVRQFSLQTCTGCHGADTRCDDGCHVKSHPGGYGTVASAFLSGDHAGARAEELENRIAVFSALLKPGEASSRAALVRVMQRRNRSTH